MSERISASEEQVLYFRALRSGLVGPGSKDVATTAQILLGAQSQQINPSLLALSQRTAGRPSAVEIENQLFCDPRSLVRCWGQRDTLHLFATEDWPLVIVARTVWQPGGRRGAIPGKVDLHPALEILEALGQGTRSDLESCVTPEFFEAAKSRWGKEEGALAFAAGRLLWQLTLAGQASLGRKVGSRQLYVTRHHWFPNLDWNPPPSEEAALELATRYLAVNGPASARDLAHFFGARVSTAKGWINVLHENSALSAIECEGRQLEVLSRDVETLCQSVPKSDSDWPLRFLPLWDTLLMGHADKSWAVPNAEERKLIWRKAAVVSAVVLARGRVVATWTQKRTTKRLTVRLEPLSLWDLESHHRQARLEADAVARHLGLESAELEVH